ncbi:hypothetical protein BB427_01940 [Pseudoalteromonas sp. BMB]|uniref:EpsG family protein n=1 Tax=Pseudoalteromonas sp. BMB TaxID=1874619 RepID=UPI00083CF2E2|nr:EpsG family protein [Pseudoalteromonas sp. BMB]ODB36798.1 hypothetical protein BB427_01940 [Pseudoalteromonas sp. BMB]
MRAKSEQRIIELAINSRHASLLFLSLSWLFLPVVLWLALVLIYSTSEIGKKPKNILPFLVSFSLALLISSRMIGFLWGGSDDMPTYLMAYERYEEFGSMMTTSLLYGQHADFLFALFSWSIAKLTNNHLFVYYLVTLLFTYALIWRFCKTVNVAYPLLCFLLIVLFYKFFQAQWHLIRACMAVPIILIGIWISKEQFRKGLLIFIIGGLFHFSTMVLLLPLFLLNKRLSKKYTISQLFGLFLVFLTGVALFIVSIKVVGSVVNHYMINKVLTRLVIEPNFSKLPSLLLFVVFTLLCSPAYYKSKSKDQITLFNISIYFCAIGVVALFFIGEELHRIILPLHLLYAPLLIHSLGVYSPSSLTSIFTIAIKSFVILAFSYVVYLNESDFFYKVERFHPLSLNGYTYLKQLNHYVEEDLQYYDGYRIK